MAGQGTCGSGAAACIAVDQALAFVDGALPPAERAGVEHRIDACPSCRAVVAEAARSAGAELVRDAHGRTSVRHPAAVTAQLRSPRAAARSAPASAHAAPPAPATEHRGPPGAAPATEYRGPPGAAPATQFRGSPGAASATEHQVGGSPGPGEARPLDAAVAALAALAPGEVVGRYVVERPLGAGGMGVVSLARDPELRRAVVIKLVHPSMGYGEGGDELEARLRREAQAMAQVSHTNVVQIFDIGRRGDRVFLAMEFIAGQTLDEWLRERRRSPDEILAMFRQAGAGLAAAHRAGLVHRDFKPSNVLVGRDGVVKVTDFGLARSVLAPVSVTRAVRPATPRPRPSGVHAVLTQANAVVGTPAYMAPEQAAGATIDARTDQYTFAVTLLDALIGQPPNRRSVPPGNPEAVDAGLARAGVAPSVRAAIARALSHDPAHRFGSIDDLMHALAPPVPVPVPPPPVVAPPPRRSRRGVLILAALALCGIAAGAWFTLLRQASEGCSAQAPGRWIGAPRDRVIAGLSRVPRPFAGWDAERVAAAIDGAVGALATAETARCAGAPSGDPEVGADCIARRSTALAAAVTALAAPSPPDDPWPLVRAIERCAAALDPAAAEQRGKLRGASAAQAREIAAAAQQRGDALLAADALEVAGRAALAAGDAKLAADQFRAMSAAGMQADSGAVQGRALLHLLEVARYTSEGEYELGNQQLVALAALLRRYHELPRDVVTAALVEGEAFTDLGDVATAFDAWARAQTAAKALGDPDAALDAAVGWAWSMHALRSDLPRARAAVQTALAEGTAASAARRTHALGIAAELALAAGDGKAAKAYLDDAARAAPADLGHRLRAQRARALLGDVDGAVAELAAMTADDATDAARIAIARGKALLAADHPSEAASVFDQVSSSLRAYGKPHAALPVAERIDLELAACEAQLAATGACKGSYRIDLLVAGLHPRAPARAELALVEAHNGPEAATRSYPLRKALEILVDAGAEPVRIAELRWQLAQLCPIGTDCRGLATAAREAFAAASRTAEVAAIDRWMVDAPPTPSWLTRDAGPGAGPDAAAPSRRDPWGPQP